MITSLIMPCYWANRHLVAMTKDCYYSLKDSGYNDLVIIVDDGSPVEATIKGTGLFKQVRKDNGGYASAVNYGLERAEGDVFIICNNDIEFIDPHWLHHLLKPLEEGYDISSIRTTDSDGWDTKDEYEQDAKFGSLWAMKRNVYETIGGLDESFGKGYFEDLDYHKRATDSGFSVVKNHNGLVHHIGKATFKEVDPADESYLAAREKFKEKYGEVW